MNVGHDDMFRSCGVAFTLWQLYARRRAVRFLFQSRDGRSTNRRRCSSDHASISIELVEKTGGQDAPCRTTSALSDPSGSG